MSIRFKLQLSFTGQISGDLVLCEVVYYPKGERFAVIIGKDSPEGTSIKDVKSIPELALIINLHSKKLAEKIGGTFPDNSEELILQQLHRLFRGNS